MHDDDPAIPVRAALYGLAARLAAERAPAELREVLDGREAPGTLQAIVDLAGNRAVREALARIGPGAPGLPPRRTLAELLERGTPRDLGRLVERHVLRGMDVREAA